MPFVRIDTQKGRYDAIQRKAIGEAVHQALLEIGVPAADRFQVFSEKAEGELVFDRNYLDIERSDGFVAVQITWNVGRSTEVKRQLYAAIAKYMAAMAGVRRGDVFVSVVEVPRENWSFGNGEAQYA
jgi:4-oxalocrotonate tautomerase